MTPCLLITIRNTSLTVFLLKGFHCYYLVFNKTYFFKDSVGSKFFNNTGFSANKENLTHLDFGSCVEFKGSAIRINESYFFNNSGYLGGSIFFYGDKEGIANVIIENTIFNKNFAYLGGSIGFPARLKKLNAFIKKCFFYENIGSGIKFIYYLEKK